ncbi:hypothetical protein BJ741DRAFT_647572 [Chytriomyces cf. hyalinus JEL632]|nr:hypothetical protein BJ741DRAFT_647572 [Chytriomyces cf. hyalinus JEL632]
MHPFAILAAIVPLSVATQSTQAFFTVLPPGLIDVPACETAVTKALQQVCDCGAHFNLEGELSLVVTESVLSACACAPSRVNGAIISAPATACKSTQSAAQQLALFSNFWQTAAEASSAAAPRTSAASAKPSISSLSPAITAATSVPASTSSKSIGYALVMGASEVDAAAMLVL